MDIAVIGGTGAEGFGLSLRLGEAGHHVTIGSRDAARGADAGERAAAILGADASVDGTSNELAARGRPVVVVTVPFVAQADIYRAIKDELRADAVILDATSPLATAVGGRPWRTVRPWEGSAAEQAASILGPAVRLVAGFHTIAAHALADLAGAIESDVLLCGDDDDAKAVVGGLVEQIPGMRWVDAGPLEMARIAEELTALLISINRRYRRKDSGFRIVGRESWGTP